MVLKFSRKALACTAGAGALAAGCTLTGIGVGTAHAATATVKPGKVSDFAVKNGSVTADGATFDWAKDAGATSYRVVIGNASTPMAGAAYDSGGKLPGTSVTVSTLAAGTAYEAKISAENSAGVSEWSSLVLFYTTAARGPSGVISTHTYTLKSDPSGNADIIPTGGRFTTYAKMIGTVHPAGRHVPDQRQFHGDAERGHQRRRLPAGLCLRRDRQAQTSQTICTTSAVARSRPYNASTPTDQVNSYYSGSSEIVVPADGETLDVYAFGYDSDHGAGSYELNSATLTATALNVAS